LDIGHKVRIRNTEKRKTSDGARFEGLVDQEDPRVVALVVEPILQLMYGLHCALDI
jgi:hypothetical protein